ncbi:MAG: hypothetical protein IPJ90_23930 [Anaerolineaceae bacterium]|nr:hypothetical protein [Anaerolineaceae bacterium]
MQPAAVHLLLLPIHKPKQNSLAAEEEERTFYAERALEEWLEALAPWAPMPTKPPRKPGGCLIVIFAQSYGLSDDGERVKHYYVQNLLGLPLAFDCRAAQRRVGLPHPHPSPVQASWASFCSAPKRAGLHQPWLLAILPKMLKCPPTPWQKRLDQFCNGFIAFEP